MKRVSKFFSNKKGQTGISDNVGNLIQTMPTPLKIGLFLLFLLLFAVVFTYILNGFGVHCSSSNQVYTLPMYDVFKNINLIFKRPSYDAVNSYAIEPEQLTIALAFECVHQVNDTHYFEGAYCTDCENVSYITYGDFAGTGLPSSSATKVCVGDVYHNPNKGWFKKWACEERNFGCDVPEYYYFDATDGYLHPLNNETIEYLSVGQMWDNKLEDLGGKLLYEDADDTGIDYQSSFRLSCSSMNPTITFYRIPIFDFRIWLMLILVSLFASFLFKLHEMDKG